MNPNPGNTDDYVEGLAKLGIAKVPGYELSVDSEICNQLAQSSAFSTGRRRLPIQGVSIA